MSLNVPAWSVGTIKSKISTSSLPGSCTRSQLAGGPQCSSQSDSDRRTDRSLPVRALSSSMLFFPEKSLYSEVCDELELQSEEFLVREIEIFTLIERERERGRERVMFIIIPFIIFTKYNSRNDRIQIL